jgi:hypothetical protein
VRYLFCIFSYYQLENIDIDNKAIHPMEVSHGVTSSILAKRPEFTNLCEHIRTY